jgi:hypothetical protein
LDEESPPNGKLTWRIDARDANVEKIRCPTVLNTPVLAHKAPYKQIAHNSNKLIIYPKIIF